MQEDGDMTAGTNKSVMQRLIRAWAAKAKASKLRMFQETIYSIKDITLGGRSSRRF